MKLLKAFPSNSWNERERSLRGMIKTLKTLVELQASRERQTMKWHELLLLHIMCPVVSLMFSQQGASHTHQSGISRNIGYWAEKEV